MRAQEEADVALLLQRKEDESLVMTLPDGREVVVTVVRVEAGKVRLGISAPRDVRVDRLEVRRELDAAEARRRAATGGATS